MRCSRCGAGVDKDARFCYECGAPLHPRKGLDSVQRQDSGQQLSDTGSRQKDGSAAFSVALPERPEAQTPTGDAAVGEQWAESRPSAVPSHPYASEPTEPYQPETSARHHDLTSNPLQTEIPGDSGQETSFMSFPPPELPDYQLGKDLEDVASFPSDDGNSISPGTVAPTPNDGRQQTIWIITAISTILVLALCLGIWWYFFHSADKEHRAHATERAVVNNGGSKPPSKPKHKVVVCKNYPDAEMQSADHHDDTLLVELSLKTNCSDENAAFAQPNEKVTIKDEDGDVVASAVFDFTANPIEFKEGKGKVDLAFSDLQHWCPFDEIDTSGAKVYIQSGQKPQGEPAADIDQAVGGANITDTDIERYAQQALSAQLDRDSSRARGVSDDITTQLSSKKYGLQAAGKTWTYRDIYQEFLQKRARHGQAILIWAQRYYTYQRHGSPSDYYVILSGETFGSVDDAKGWCSTTGYSSDDCMAVNLSDD